jgi:UDP-N-acetylglucosamine:LPS N-acetylglucosamine transferase
VTKVLAVASMGGHWEQLQIVAEAFDDKDAVFVTTTQDLLKQANRQGFVVKDCNRNRPGDTLTCVWQCIKIIRNVRPNVIISTGAAPGLICLLLGRLTGAKTIWIDSFANVEKLSMSGKIAGYIVHEWLTQWKHLATPKGPFYRGELL